MLSIPLCVKAQSPLGIGVVWIDFEEKSVVEFYKSPDDDQPGERLVFFNDPVISGINIKDHHKTKKWLQPEIINLEYYHLNFRCLSQNDNWFQIITNNEDGVVMWIKRSELTKFQVWKEYLISMFGVERINTKTQKIYQRPDDKSNDVEYIGKDCFRIKNLQDDWIEIYTSDECIQKNKPIVKSGWIKWKQGDKMLIEYHTTS